jgi:hypothetical protein
MVAHRFLNVVQEPRRARQAAIQRQAVLANLSQRASGNQLMVGQVIERLASKVQQVVRFH